MGASGNILVDFGPFPGTSDAQYTVTGADLDIAGLLTNSEVEAWIEPANTVDHSADEHMLETIKVFADKSGIVAGTSFPVRAFNTSELSEPLEEIKGRQTATTGVLQAAQGSQRQFAGGQGTRLYGKWNVGVAWN